MDEQKIDAVYVIGVSRDGPVKIGVLTAARPVMRKLRSLQYGNPDILSVFYLFQHPAADDLETWVRRQLQDYRTRREKLCEWFNVTADYAAAFVEQGMRLFEDGELPRRGKTIGDCFVCRECGEV